MTPSKPFNTTGGAPNLEAIFYLGADYSVAVGAIGEKLLQLISFHSPPFISEQALRSFRIVVTYQMAPRPPVSLRIFN